MSSRVSAKQLLKHLKRMSDREIRDDLEDCVLPVAATEEDVEQLIRYAEQRKQAPHFSPRKSGHNNHKYIDG